LKKSILALCALTVAAGLSACGGGTSSYTIGGTVTGLEHPGLVLLNNSANDLPVPQLPKDANGNVTYSFPNEVDYGEPYNVTVKTNPAHQTCVPFGGTSDTAGRLSSINAVISCSLLVNSIGGTITGLAADGLKLINGTAGGSLTVSKDTTTNAYPTTFTFPVGVTYDQTYGVTVLDQPTGQTCTVANGTGKMGDNKVDTIAVTCVNNPSPTP
jgi:hypothetical protein